MKTISQYLEEAIAPFSGFVLARSQMPQIDDIDVFGQFLFENDIMFYEKRVFIDGIADFKPTQVEYDEEKVESMYNDFKKSIDEHAKPVIVADGYVIDGHHRYYAIKQLSEVEKAAYGKAESMYPIMSIQLPLNQALKYAYEFYLRTPAT